MKSPFSRTSPPTPAPPLRGSFTMDLDGNVIFSTLASTVSERVKEQIGRAVLAAFGAAAESKVRVTEFTVQYAALRITAREMRGGVLVFVTPCGGAKKHSVA